MQNAYFSFLNVVNKNARRVILLGILVTTLGAADPSPSVSPSPEATPTSDLTQVPEFTLQEAQKNVSKDQYQIGDRISLLAEIKTSAIENGEKLSLKLSEGSSKLEEQGWYVDQSTQFMGGIFRFIVSPIQTGTLTLPTLLVLKEDQTIIGRTSPFSIQVTGPAKAEGKAPELLALSATDLPAKYWVIFSIIILLVLCAIAYAFVYFLRKRRKKPLVRVPQAPTESDHAIALRRIERLYEEFPYSRSNLKPLSFGLSEVLKTFISKRFKVDASESTTDEMIELLRKEAITGANLREIQMLFQDLDLVKFTKNENYSHIDEAAYRELKVKSQLIVQKWALATTSPRGDI